MRDGETRVECRWVSPVEVAPTDASQGRPTAAPTGSGPLWRLHTLRCAEKNRRFRVRWGRGSAILGPRRPARERQSGRPSARKKASFGGVLPEIGAPPTHASIVASGVSSRRHAAPARTRRIGPDQPVTLPAARRPFSPETGRPAVHPRKPCAPRRHVACPRPLRWGACFRALSGEPASLSWRNRSPKSWSSPRDRRGATVG
jgi:hypothetical protein